MLDDVTKRRINTLRQILVGKLPDPKAQVEQITNGLIYKFMNDMDEQSVSMRGKATYFSGKFKKYSWKNLLDTKTSGVEKVALYSEAIGQMHINENLPELFREIFKDSFLPFKDPSTLNMFLKEINEFNYSHSEKLGDAFEYLLSFMGSQGDAGQFRTPRHIIDFIIEIVNPQKNETILDPACGTAGFLISSYKHILKQNTKKNSGDLLNAANRKKIGENLNGYDISPDMVKMSLVNMYLHKFTNPNIIEYDTLSSEEKWNEYYDVMLANPPFFSPKGGITPHNRFGVKSTKAEVLFVDYINEHLKPNGRAGIIVPEGIIFQSGSAYKQLRKRLIETSLIGVVSLPAGVFQPYSGVKTSILFLDKEKNKKNKDIFFSKVTNDGYDLTANRRPVENSDLPNIVKNLTENKKNNLVEFVKKDEFLKEDYSFNLSKYKNDKIINSNFNVVNLKDYANLQRGTSITKKDIGDENIPVIAGGQKPAYFHNKSNRKSNCITVSSSGAYAGYVSFHMRPIFASDCFTIETNNDFLNQKFLFYLLKSKQELIYTFQTGGGQPHVYAKDFDKFKIPLPPIETQNQIVEELDSYQKIIDGCRQVIENYRPSIDIDPSWELVELGEVISLLTDYHANGSYEILKKNVKLLDTNNYALMVRTTNFENNDFNKKCKYIDENSYNFLKKSKVFKEDIIINKIGSAGSIYIMPDLGRPVSLAMNQFLIRSDRSKINTKYLYYYLKIKEKNIKEMSHGAVTKTITKNEIKSIKIHLPSKEIQNKISEELNDEEKTIVNNKKLIVSMEKKIDEKINKLWSS